MTQVLDRERLEDIGTMRDDDLCHAAVDRRGPPWRTLCGLALTEPACCGPGDPKCGRPPCPECRAELGALGASW